jgi:hypothetical protein
VKIREEIAPAADDRDVVARRFLVTPDPLVLPDWSPLAHPQSLRVVRIAPIGLAGGLRVWWNLTPLE